MKADSYYFSGRFIAVNQLKPYPGWEEAFRDTIMDRVGEVQSELGPMAIARTGLRYILTESKFRKVPWCGRTGSAFRFRSLGWKNHVSQIFRCTSRRNFPKAVSFS